MAKRRRRKSAKASPPLDSTSSKPREPRKHLDSTECPNHNGDFYLREPPGVPFNKGDILIYPLMRLMMSEDGGGASTGLAFVDDVYGCTSWLDRDTHAPPTWMDPEVFIRMVVADSEVEKICRGYLKKRDDGTRAALRRRIGEIYEEQYLVYMIEKFDTVEDLLAQWTVAHFAGRKEDEEIAEYYKKNPVSKKVAVKKKPTAKKKRRVII